MSLEVYACEKGEKKFKGFREIQKIILHLKSYVEANIHRRQ